MQPTGRSAHPSLPLHVIARPAVWAQAEEFDRVTDLGEAGLLGDLLGPALDGAAFDLDAATAVPAGQMVVVGVGLAAPVQDLARRSLIASIRPDSLRACRCR